MISALFGFLVWLVGLLALQSFISNDFIVALIVAAIFAAIRASDGGMR